MPEIWLRTLTFAVLSSSLGGEGVVTRLQKVNGFENCPLLRAIIQKVKK